MLVVAVAAVAGAVMVTICGYIGVVVYCWTSLYREPAAECEPAVDHTTCACEAHRDKIYLLILIDRSMQCHCHMHRDHKPPGPLSC